MKATACIFGLCRSARRCGGGRPGHQRNASVVLQGTGPEQVKGAKGAERGEGSFSLQYLTFSIAAGAVLSDRHVKELAPQLTE